MGDVLITLSVQPKTTEGVDHMLDVSQDFTMDPAIRAMYSMVTVSSYDVEELAVEEGEDEYQDRELLDKVVDTLVAENFVPDSARNIIDILHKAGIGFREL